MIVYINHDTIYRPAVGVALNRREVGRAEHARRAKRRGAACLRRAICVVRWPPICI